MKRRKGSGRHTQYQTWDIANLDVRGKREALKRERVEDGAFKQSCSQSFGEEEVGDR
jgi:hypothetical protein